MLDAPTWFWIIIAPCPLVTLYLEIRHRRRQSREKEPRT